MAYKETVIVFDPLIMQKAVWERLNSIKSSDRIGSAYLFSGPGGSGKEALSLCFGKHLNCEKIGSSPCNICPSCQRFNQLQHEELKLVFPLPVPRKKVEKQFDNEFLEIIEDAIKKKAADPFYKIQIPKANRILIQSIRDLRRTLYFKVGNKGRKVVLFFDAHLLSSGQNEAANALLKILEEPPDNTTLILVTDHKEQLLPTILSRCQHLAVPRLSDNVIESWLSANGINNDDISFITGLSSGNIHQARLFMKQPVKDIITLLDKLIETFTTQDPESWRSFIQKYSQMANNDIVTFKFHFRILSLWFRSVYLFRKDIPDLLHETELKYGMETFLNTYPDADLLAINLLFDEVSNSIKKNYYMPLALINLLLDIQNILQS